MRAYYEVGLERDRLAHGYSRLEFVRTQELLSRYLPSEPAHVLDVGGGPGAYAAWLADAGHRVRVIDATPLHVEQARELAGSRFEAVEGDARALDEPDGAYRPALARPPLPLARAR